MKKGQKTSLYDENGLISGMNEAALDYSCGDGATWNYDEQTKTLKFEGVGAIAKRENYEP